MLPSSLIKFGGLADRPAYRQIIIRQFILDISGRSLWVVAAFRSDLCLCGRWMTCDSSRKLACHDKTLLSGEIFLGTCPIVVRSRNTATAYRSLLLPISLLKDNCSPMIGVQMILNTLCRQMQLSTDSLHSMLLILVVSS